MVSTNITFSVCHSLQDKQPKKSSNFQYHREQLSFLWRSWCPLVHFESLRWPSSHYKWQGRNFGSTIGGVRWRSIQNVDRGRGAPIGNVDRPYCSAEDCSSPAPPLLSPSHTASVHGTFSASRGACSCKYLPGSPVPKSTTDYVQWYWGGYISWIWFLGGSWPP